MRDVASPGQEPARRKHETEVAVDAARTVLVVDDDQAIVELLRDFLEAEGFAVQGALDAGDAAAILEQRAIDCVLLDVMMSGQSGFDLCRQIRSRSEVPILFLSARRGHCEDPRPGPRRG